MESLAIFHFSVRGKNEGKVLFKYMTQRDPEDLTPNSYSDP